MEILETCQSIGLKPKKVSVSKGGEYAMACPSCGGKDRFRVWPHQKRGSYWCRQCNIRGDYIQFLRTFLNKTFKEAKEISNSYSEEKPLKRLF